MPDNYHARELEIAKDVSHPLRALPSISANHRRILDVGCGMGQTLIGLELPYNAQGVGIDLDVEALIAGAKLVPENVCLLASSGEKLPFKNEQFDFVICRVSLPYMRIDSALSEFWRVLNPGGEIWLILHPARMTLRRMRKSVLKGDVADVLFSSYVLLNGACFNLIGKQYSFFGHQETFQTPRGITRALLRARFKAVTIRFEKHFIVTASKKD